MTITREFILDNVHPILLSSMKVPENVHKLTMEGFYGVNLVFAVITGDYHNRQMMYVTDESMKKFHITDHNLVDSINILQYAYTFDTMDNFIPVPCNDKSHLYILTSDSCQFGSGMICVDSILRQVASIINDDFYILPSSVHELILVPCSMFSKDDNAEDTLLDMVWDVNHRFVHPDERLSNHVYKVNKDTLKFTTIHAKRLI